MNQKKRYENKLISMSARSNVRQAGAISELKDPNTIYMLGETPVYVHSHEQYIKQGLKTAKLELSSILTKVVEETKNKISKIIPILEAQTKEIYKTFNFDNVNEFINWWGTEIEKDYENWGEKDEKSSNLYYLSLLKHYKKLQLMKALTRPRNGASEWLNIKDEAFATLKTNWETDDNEANSEKGFINAANRKLRAISKEFRNADNLADLVSKKYKNATLVDNTGGKGSTIEAIAYRIKKGIELNAEQIGKLEEFLAGTIKKEISTKYGDAILEITHAAAEDIGKSTKNIKSDSKYTIKSNGKVILEFFSSDKTGMEYCFGKNYVDKSRIIDRFTANIETKTGFLSNVGSMVEVDPSWDNIIRYIMLNSFKRGIGELGRESRTKIVYLFAWTKLLNEIIAGDGNFLPFVKVFNHWYPTSEILNIFLKLKQEDIRDYINVTKVKDFMNRKTDNIDAAKLADFENKKKEALSDLQLVSYKTLKNALNEELEELNDTLKSRLSFKTYYSIQLNNIRNKLKK